MSPAAAAAPRALLLERAGAATVLACAVADDAGALVLASGAACDVLDLSAQPALALDDASPVALPDPTLSSASPCEAAPAATPWRLLLWPPAEAGAPPRAWRPQPHELAPGEQAELDAIIGALHPPARPPVEVRQVVELALDPDALSARLFVVEAQRTDERGAMSALLVRHGAPRDAAPGSPAPILPVHGWPAPGLRLDAATDLDGDGLAELVLRIDGAATPRWLVEQMPPRAGVRRLGELACDP